MLLHPYLEETAFRQGELIYNLRAPITQVYFPTTAVLSWLHSSTEGETVEVGATGFEGVLGNTLLLNQSIIPWHVHVQLAGQGFQCSAEIFVEALSQSPVLREKLNHFTYYNIVQLTQSALCNRFHTLEQRLCRWLLACQDRAQTNELLLTREILASMVGSTRPAVSLAAGTLQSAGLIRTTRGRITILNREEMEEATCECYRMVKWEFDRYLQNLYIQD